MEPGEDLVAEAAKRGTILAALTLGADLPDEGFLHEPDADPTKPPASDGEAPLDAPKR
jgi:hypothetical protein